MRRLVQLALIVAGVTLFVALVRHIGTVTLVADLRRFGRGLLVVVALELLVDACNTQGWRHAFAARSPFGFWHLYWVRQAGTAMNQLTPTAGLGGEVVKAMLLKPHIPTTEALASLIAAKLSFALAQTAVVLLGLALLLERLRDAPGMATGVVVASAATVAGVIGFLVVQRRGLFSWLADAAARLGLHGSLVQRLQRHGGALDEHLAALYRERPEAFRRSIAWHLGGQGVSLVQLLVVLAWLGTPVTLATGLALEAFALVIDSALFFVPARIGVQEAGRVLVFTSLGMGAATGLAVGVIVRVTQLAVTGIGLGAFGYFSLTSAPVADSTSEP